MLSASDTDPHYIVLTGIFVDAAGTKSFDEKSFESSLKNSDFGPVPLGTFVRVNTWFDRAGGMDNMTIEQTSGPKVDTATTDEPFPKPKRYTPIYYILDQLVGNLRRFRFGYKFCLAKVGDYEFIVSNWTGPKVEKKTLRFQISNQPALAKPAAINVEIHDDKLSDAIGNFYGEVLKSGRISLAYNASKTLPEQLTKHLRFSFNQWVIGTEAKINPQDLHVDIKQIDGPALLSVQSSKTGLSLAKFSHPKFQVFQSPDIPSTTFMPPRGALVIPAGTYHFVITSHLHGQVNSSEIMVGVSPTLDRD